MLLIKIMFKYPILLLIYPIFEQFVAYFVNGPLKKNHVRSRWPSDIVDGDYNFHAEKYLEPSQILSLISRISNLYQSLSRWFFLLSLYRLRGSNEVMTNGEHFINLKLYRNTEIHEHFKVMLELIKLKSKTIHCL